MEELIQLGQGRAALGQGRAPALEAQSQPVDPLGSPSAATFMLLTTAVLGAVICVLSGSLLPSGHLLTSQPWISPATE